MLAAHETCFTQTVIKILIHYQNNDPLTDNLKNSKCSIAGWATSQANSLILLKKTIFSQNHQIKGLL